MEKHIERELQSDAENERREFLRRCGKFAVVTPPAVVMLLSAATTPAHATASGFGARDTTPVNLSVRKKVEAKKNAAKEKIEAKKEAAIRKLEHKREAAIRKVAARTRLR